MLSSTSIIPSTILYLRHIEYLERISDYLGGSSILSIDILVARDGREFIHSCSLFLFISTIINWCLFWDDRLRYFGESQEEDRRETCALIQHLLFPVMHNEITNGKVRIYGFMEVEISK